MRLLGRGSSCKAGVPTDLAGPYPKKFIPLSRNSLAFQWMSTQQRTICNRVFAGTVPRPTSGGVWLIDDIADYLDRTRKAPDDHKAA